MSLRVARFSRSSSIETDHCERASPVVPPCIGSPTRLNHPLQQTAASELCVVQSLAPYTKAADYIVGGIFSCCFSVSMSDFTPYALDGSLGHSLCGTFHGTHDRPFDKGAICGNWVSGQRENPASLFGTPREMRFAPPWLPSFPTAPAPFVGDAAPAPEQWTNSIVQERP
jgi:hypothetical protein